VSGKGTGILREDSEPSLKPEQTRVEKHHRRSTRASFLRAFRALSYIWRTLEDDMTHTCFSCSCIHVYLELSSTVFFQI